MHRSPLFRLACSALAMRQWLALALLAFCLPTTALALGNGKLQVHHINVGQGDGTLLITPLGQTVLFDDGVYTNCTNIKSYLQGLGITTVDYHILSHYHADHLGCIDDLAAVGITIGVLGYDRGSSYSSASYTNYVNTLGAKRATMVKGQVLTLDAGATNPVRITCVDLNGAGVYSPSGSDENAKSLVARVTYGAFDEVIAGDLTGSSTSGNDVETTIGPQVGDVEVYKVHHHGSRYSSNDNWLTATAPEVGIIQCGDGNTYGHPTAEALARIHAHGIKTYWTETGAGATPDPAWDKVANGTIVIQADPGATATYTVSGPGFSDIYANGGRGGGPTPITQTLVASGMTMLKGSIATGDVTRLSADDALRVSVSAGLENSAYVTDWYGSVFLNGSPTKLSGAYDGNYTISRTQTLSLWDWTTSAWVQVASGTVSTTDVNQTWSTTAPAAYVSGAREVRLRVRSNTRKNGSFTSRGDYMAFTYDYLPAATITPMFASAGSKEADESGMEEPLEHLLPLTALREISSNVTSEGVVLDWSTDLYAHLDGFAVYREDRSGNRVELGGETVLPPQGDAVRFRFVDANPDPVQATYWLGARSCGGVEGVIGPIRVHSGDRVAATTGQDLLSASPNPAAGPVRLAFSMTRGSQVRLDIFDASGRRLASVFEGYVPPGAVEFSWRRQATSGAAVAPGVYFARLETAGRSQVVKLVLAQP